MTYKNIFFTCLFLVIALPPVFSQDYFFSKFAPFDQGVPTPEEFLGYPIGSRHTRHDKIVAYLDELAKTSNRATIARYGETYEHRELVILTVTDPQNQENINEIQAKHLQFVNPDQSTVDKDLPIFINLAYNVHGNEPSSSEAALLSAYVLASSQHSDIPLMLPAFR